MERQPLKIKICPECADAHATNIVDMYKDLKSPLEKIKNEKDQGKSKEMLEKLMHDSVTMGLYRNHGPLNVEIDKGTMHILDVHNNRLCE